MKNKFYFSWGDEPVGFVTTWELLNGEVSNLKHEPKEVIKKQNLKFWCAFS